MEHRTTAPLVYIVDTPEMTEFCREVLRHYCGTVSVETFSNPIEAMFAFTKARVRPQVVAASLLNMQGLRLAEDVKEIDPSVRVLLMSGLETQAITQKLGNSRVTPDSVLPKPFSPEDFSSRIQSLIE
jgi:response regulator RpfG family c-di-GMP phosphodiesterase